MLHSFTNTDYSQSVILLMRVYGLPGVLVVRDLPAKKKTWIVFLGQEDQLEKEVALHFRILAWRVP